MYREFANNHAGESVNDASLQLRREELMRRFLLHDETTSIIRAAYTAKGANLTQSVFLREPDTGAHRGQIQYVGSHNTYGHIINLRNSLGRNNFFVSVAFKSYGFTGIINPAHMEAPVPVHLDDVYEIMAPVTGYCEWDVVPENVPHQQLDVRRILEAARQVR